MISELIKRVLFRDEYLKTLGLPRSSQWKFVREKWLKDHPKSAVCGSTKDVVPHHIIPFNSDPSLELDPNNPQQNTANLSNNNDQQTNSVVR
jgi:hypothetical protein